MKVGILTLSASDNCGSLFQTYALQKYLTDSGHEVEVINFVTSTAKRMYRIFHPGYIKQPKKFFGQFKNISELRIQKKSYERFRTIINLTDDVYKNSYELESMDGKYDIVIVGSDQVWSVNMRDFDYAYFLEWCKKSRKISYAASLGSKNENTYNTFNKYKRAISSLDNISVREESSRDIVSKIIGQQVSVCIDPTLLLNEKIWHEVVDENVEKPTGDYIFYYSYGYINEKKNRLVSQFAEKMRLPVYVINASRWVDGKDKQYGFLRIKDDGPYAFLSLMKYCKYSFVESFHGIIFSYIFRRNFWYVEHDDVYMLDERIDSILSLLNMKHRIMYTDNLKMDDLEIDYKKDNKNLQIQKDNSKKYLEEVLKNK